MKIVGQYFVEQNQTETKVLLTNTENIKYQAYFNTSGKKDEEN